MSATEGAFIEAYSDDPATQAQQASAARHKLSPGAGTSAVTSARPQPSARRGANHAKRAAAAAALQNAPPAQQTVATQSVMEAKPPKAVTPAAPVEPIAARAEQKPKMVVGRRALQQLAQSAAAAPRALPVPTPVLPHPAVASQPLAETAEPLAKPQRVPGGVKPPVLPIPAYQPASNAAPPLAASEVDRFNWPQVCSQLIEQEQTKLEPVAAAIAEAMAKGANAIAIAAAVEGDGATTITMCLARMLAGERSVCMVDGDFAQPTLAESLGLAPEQGMSRVLTGEAELADVLVDSLEDGLTLLPLTAPVAADVVERSKLRQTVMFGELRERFDLVLVDAGSITARGGTPRSVLHASSGIDAAIIVRSTFTDEGSWQEARKSTLQWTMPCLGVIENR